ncbi:MAG: hypothetical protein Q7T20_11485 [Saprospiraceae bacterium]|nr:hypothetical protein [Saprospiraceae bacterium]
MTIKRFHFAFILIASLAVSISAQTTAGKTFTKAFNTDGKGTMRLELPGAIDLKVWDSPSIRFEISVSLPSGNGPMLNELANIGRYNLAAKPDGDVLVVTAPNLQKQLKVKGQEFKETLSFVVFIPKDLQVQVMPNVEILADAKK